MKIKGSLPYPVLGHEDDVLPGLSADDITIQVVADKRNYTFSISLIMENEEILRLIEEDLAEFTCEVTCARTYLRKCYHSSEPGFSIEIPRHDVIGEVGIDCYVTVKKDIMDYTNPQFNPDYDGAFFDMEPGDILAKYPYSKYVAQLKYDKLYSAGSFMVVLEGEENKGVWFDANDDKILVYLPKSMYEQFKTLSVNKDFNELFHASIVFNALVKVLMDYDPARQSNRLWAQAIQTRIDTEAGLSHFSMENKAHAYELAQALLADPYKRMFNNLHQQQAN